MTARAYLSQAAQLKRRIGYIKERIAEIREEMVSIKALRYDRDVVQVAPRPDPLVDYLDRLRQEEERLGTLGMEYTDKVGEICTRIMDVTPGLYSDVLYRRYICGQNLHVIADDLNYSYVWICKIHGKALLEFARLHPDI